MSSLYPQRSLELPNSPRVKVNVLTCNGLQASHHLVPWPQTLLPSPPYLAPATVFRVAPRFILRTQDIHLECPLLRMQIFHMASPFTASRSWLSVILPDSSI